jgi:uncharacterized protein (DUF305 family)
MSKETILYGLIGVLVGIIVTFIVYPMVVVDQDSPEGGFAIFRRHKKVQKAEPKKEEIKIEIKKGDVKPNEGSMLKGKTGDEFDKAFINEMIAHHQVAVDMANLAKTTAKHDEIKKMCDDVIKAQSAEIETMKKWKTTWGYDK